MAYLANNISKNDLLNAYNVVEIYLSAINNESLIFDLTSTQLRIIKKNCQNNKDLSLLIHYFSNNNCQIKAYQSTFNCTYDNARCNASNKFKKLNVAIKNIKEEFCDVARKEYSVDTKDALSKIEEEIRHILSIAMNNKDINLIAKCLDVLYSKERLLNPIIYPDYKTYFKEIKQWITK